MDPAFFIFKDNKVYGIYVTDSRFIKTDPHFYCASFLKLCKLHNSNKTIASTIPKFPYTVT